MKSVSMRSYGAASNVAIAGKPNTDTLILTGMGETERWARVMTRRAAHMLWYRLTWALFPEKSSKVTGMAATAPLRTNAQPTITTHIDLALNAETHAIQIMGISGQEGWQFWIDAHAAHQLWAALDVLLYPAGWEGARTQVNKAN